MPSTSPYQNSSNIQPQFLAFLNPFLHPSLRHPFYHTCPPCPSADHPASTPPLHPSQPASSILLTLPHTPHKTPPPSRSPSSSQPEHAPHFPPLSGSAASRCLSLPCVWPLHRARSCGTGTAPASCRCASTKARYASKCASGCVCPVEACMLGEGRAPGSWGPRSW